MLRELLFICFTLGSIQTYSQSGHKINSIDSIKKHRVIGFGEACHGSYSDYKARAELIKALILDGDSIDIMIEMPQFTGIAIKKYYNGEIDSDTLIKEAKYYGLQTDAFLDFIDEFKNNKLVSFYGVDMQTHRSTLEYISEIVFKRKPHISSKIEPILDQLNKSFLWNYSDSAFLLIEESVENNLAKLSNIIDKEFPESIRENFEIHYPLKIVQQYIQMVKYIKNGQLVEYNLYRDSCMAQNVITIESHSKKKCIVLAANGHLMNTGNVKYVMMGGHLKNYYKDEYFIIVSQYYQGHLLEVDVVDGERKIIPKQLNPPIRRSIPYIIDKTYKPSSDTLILLKHEGKLLNRKVYGQDMGAGRGDYKKAGLGVFKPFHYDAIYYIPIVVASKNILFRLISN